MKWVNDNFVRNILIAVFVVVGCVFLSGKVFADQGVISGLLSQIPKSRSSEGIENLTVLKENLLECLGSHPGNESSCNNLGNNSATQSFTYDFSKPPQDGSKAWELRATGSPSAGLSKDDQIFLTSDEGGNIACKSMGVFTGVC